MAELIETQRMEEAARRRHDEKLRRVKQQQQVAQAEKETAEKIAARAFSRVRTVSPCRPWLSRAELPQPAAAVRVRAPARPRLLL